VQEHAKDLEASKKNQRDAEAKDASVEDLQTRLNNAELALLRRMSRLPSEKPI
jgi:hypothetical protein